MRLLLRVALAAALLAGAAPADAQLTIRLVRVPDDTPVGGPIFVAGSFNRWNPADSAWVLRMDGGGYFITLPDSVRGPVEFKFTRGSWDRVEVDAAGADVPNRRFTIPASGRARLAAEIAKWRDGTPRPRPASTARPGVSVLDTAFAMPQLGGRTRRVWVYLPPDYAATEKRYPVLYMHDGQNVFDDATAYAGEWGVDEALDSLHAQGDRGAIVVAVDNGGERRLDEYSPWRNARYDAGGEGDEYADFLAIVLKPYIDAHYRTMPDREHTGVAGSSMGGLISLYAALRHPEVFGRAGVFSPAFWFAGDSAFAHARAAGPPRAEARLWFVTGAREGDTPEVYVRDAERMAGMLADAGFTVEASIREDGTHSEGFWRREFPAAYRWLFQPSTP